MPSQESPSPYEGLLQLVMDQCAPGDVNLVLSLIETKPDYDAHSQKPQPGPFARGARQSPYLTRFEDIDASWVKEYLLSVIIGIKIQRNGGLQEHRRKYREIPALIGNDGEVVDAAELLVEQVDAQPSAVATAKARLPYLLKRLYDKGCQLGVSAMSAVIAYEKAKPSAVSRVMPKAFLAGGVYLMPKSAGATWERLFNNNRLLQTALTWVRGDCPDPYYWDALELVRICELLGVDIKEEDPCKYGHEFVDSLVVLYITKNREYIDTMRGRNPQVISSLCSINPQDYVQRACTQRTYYDIAEDVMQAVLDCSDPTIATIRNLPGNITLVASFLRAYATTDSTFQTSSSLRYESLGMNVPENAVPWLVPAPCDFITNDGFMYFRAFAQRPRLFKVSHYTQGEGDFAVAHISGYLFMVRSDNSIVYASMQDVISYIEERSYSETGTLSSQYGRWSVCFA